MIKTIKNWLIASLFSCFTVPVLAATITISVGDGAGEGFNDATYGADRVALFEYAADLLEPSLNTSVDIIVNAKFDPLFCDANSATLGQAGPTNVSYDFAEAAATDLMYPLALANALHGSDLSPGVADIDATFNSNLDSGACLGGNTWYYGFDAPPAGKIDLLTVVLHELLHGLGFVSYVGQGGNRPFYQWLDGNGVVVETVYLDDVFMRNIKKNGGTGWADLDGKNSNSGDATRASDAVSDNLVWTGSNVNAALAGLSAGTLSSQARMYSPSPYDSGSSVSHFDTRLSPDEIMEPIHTGFKTDIGLAYEGLLDIGWPAVVVTNTAPTITITGTPYSTNEDTAKIIDASSWDADADGDTVTFTVSSCPANITCAIDSDGQNLTLTPASNYNGATNSVEITVTDDGVGALSASDTFNLAVTAQNDAPEWSAISTQNVTIGGSSVDVNLDTYASDAEGDTLSYSEVSCGTGLTCSLSGSTMTLSGISNDGATVTVEVQANDGNSGLTNKTFSVTINAAANSAPSWATIPTQNLTVGDTATINLNSYTTDSNGDTMTYTGCESTSICSISSNTLTINTASVDSESITINANDGNSGSTDSASFTINIFETPTVTANGATLETDESANIDNDIFEIDVSSVSNGSTFTLDFEGNSSDDLLNLSGDSLTIGMPTSGQFAGTYTLTLSDADTGDSYDYTLIRAPRLTFSATKLLEDSAVQTLKIEGGAAGTVFALTSSETGLSFSQSNAAITDVMASDDADNYNSADVVLNVGTIISSTTVSISVSSIFETAMSNDISLEPKATHIITVQDNGSAPLAQSTIELDMSLLAAFNIPESYTTNSTGQSTVTLPSDDSNYSAEVQLSGYTSQSITLNSDSTEQTITLEKVINPLNLSGTISGDGNMTFNAELPTVELTLTDNTKVSLSVSLLNSNQAEFNYIHDLNTGDVRSLTISHSDSETIEINLLTRNSLVFDIHLSKQVQIVVISSESAGTIHPLNLMFLLLLLLTFRRHRLIT